MNGDELLRPSEQALLKAMELAWKDHHHARDQTWKTVQMVAVLGAGLVTIDFQHQSVFASASAAALVVITAAIGVGITWNHRHLERRKFIHLMNCEELLGLHRDDVIPLHRGNEWAKGKSALVLDGAVKVPRMYGLLDIMNPLKHNTSLFILRTHLAIMAFALLVVAFRWNVA